MCVLILARLSQPDPLPPASRLDTPRIAPTSTSPRRFPSSLTTRCLPSRLVFTPTISPAGMRRLRSTRPRARSPLGLRFLWRRTLQQLNIRDSSRFVVERSERSRRASLRRFVLGSLVLCLLAYYRRFSSPLSILPSSDKQDRENCDRARRPWLVSAPFDSIPRGLVFSPGIGSFGNGILARR